MTRMSSQRNIERISSRFADRMNSRTASRRAAGAITSRSVPPPFTGSQLMCRELRCNHCGALPRKLDQVRNFGFEMIVRARADHPYRRSIRVITLFVWIVVDCLADLLGLLRNFLFEPSPRSACNACRLPHDILEIGDQIRRGGKSALRQSVDIKVIEDIPVDLPETVALVPGNNS